MAGYIYLSLIYVIFGSTSSHLQFFLPVPLEEGWIVLMWDMMSRKLHLLDPLIRGDGPSEAKKGKLEMIVWKLHHALFECLNEYYVGWPTQGSQWVTKYPVVAEESFTRYDTKMPNCTEINSNLSLPPWISASELILSHFFSSSCA